MSGQEVFTLSKEIGYRGIKVFPEQTEKQGGVHAQGRSDSLVKKKPKT